MALVAERFNLTGSRFGACRLGTTGGVLHAERPATLAA